MKLKLLALVLFAASALSAQVSIGIRIGPPPLPRIVRVRPPSPGRYTYGSTAIGIRLEITTGGTMAIGLDLPIRGRAGYRLITMDSAFTMAIGRGTADGVTTITIGIEGATATIATEIETAIAASTRTSAA